MVEPVVLQIRQLRLRVRPGILAASTDAALRDAVRRQLPAQLDPAVAEPLAAGVARAARDTARRPGSPSGGRR